MITRSTTLAAALAALASSLLAQVDRDQALPVAYEKLHDASYGDILGYAIQGYRLSNVEIASTNPTRFHGTVVENTGAYSRSWTFYYDKTKNELALALIQNNQRPVDLERYEVNGQVKYAAIAFANTGPAQKTWNWFTNVQHGSVLTTVQNVGGRIIDIEPYNDGQEWRYEVLSIKNTGSDYKAWWVYTSTSKASVLDHMNVHGSRVYDYEEKNILTSDVCVLVRDNVKSKTFFDSSWHPSWTQDEHFGGRVIDFEHDSLSSRPITIVDNLDPFEVFGTPTSGTHGPTVHLGWGDAMTGTQVQYTVSNLWAWAPAAIHIGFYKTVLPLDLLGAAGCEIYTLPAVAVGLFSGPNGVASVNLDLPNDPAAHNAKLITQMVAVDPGANELGVQCSNGLETRVRHW